MENKWLICLDLDGTLLNRSEDWDNEQEYHPKNKEVISKLIADGHIVVPITGRPAKHSRNVYKEFGMNSKMINLSGSQISNPLIGTEEELRPMDKEKLYDIFDKLDDAGLVKNILIECGEYSEVILNDPSPWIKRVLRRKKVIVIDKPMLKHIEPLWVYLEINTDVDTELINKLNDESQDFYLRLWSINKCDVLEIGQKKNNKGTIIFELADEYNIPHTNIIAFGDGVNDIDMLTNASVGVAMKNARDEVKNVANYVTEKTNVEGGVGFFIENFIK